MEEGIKKVAESLSSIENILKAEEKRRKESNQVIREYIDSYLNELQASLTRKVSSEFTHLQRTIDSIDTQLTLAEKQLQA